ncbi:putative Co/Zn/Cd efflux system membrane fusion domain protein, partial [Vibrio parahaemolyticus SBR10290]
WVWT